MPFSFIGVVANPNRKWQMLPCVTPCEPDDWRKRQTAGAGVCGTHLGVVQSCSLLQRVIESGYYASLSQ